MDRTSEVKFSDLQNDERYKKLERALKLAYLKKGVRMDESWPSPMSPSMSSINVDASDVNSNVPDPRSFRVGSEIVSSSNNLRNIVLRKDANNIRRTICTSSVRDLNSTNSVQEDYFMMPPPNFNFIPGASKKANSTPLSNVPRTVPAFQSKCVSSNLAKQSPKKTNSTSPQTSPINATQHAKDRIRIFTRWKVMLNEQGQLLIQGTINGKQLARSKPIVRRLAPAKVQSFLNHVYHLEGDIVDKEHELPDYVRGKFYNGFPDDWENVHQIWQVYRQQGSRLTFRWPTSITDSDDDLRSEVTNLTYASTDLEMNTDKENFNVPSFNVSKDNPQNRNKEHCTQLATAPAEYSYGDSKRNKLKDKLNIIVNSIADKNCPQEFVSKIIEIFDCLHYVVSYGSSRENESNTENSTIDKSIVQEQRRGASNDLLTPSKNGMEFNKSKCKNTDAYPSKSIVTNDCPLKSKNSTKANNCIDKDSSDSESEVYTGIPKIPAERILRQREVLMKNYKRKTRSTKLLQRDCEVSEKKQTSLITTENINHMPYNDSSVSIIGEQTEFSEVEKSTNSKIENNVNKDINLAKTIRSHWKETNASTNEKNPRKTKEHFVNENPTSLRKLTENCSDSSDINESDTRKMSKTLEHENAISETNFRKKTSDKQNSNVANNKYQASSNTSKPVVISSVPIDINNIYKEIKSPRNVDRVSRESIKEVQHLTKEKSPVKPPNALKNIDSDLSIDSDRKEHEESRKLTQLDHTDICRDKQENDEIRTEKLSVWYPKLICEPTLGLCFEGKLLNDAGHVVNRKFETDPILRRISSKLVETINHKFYELVGDFNKHKHVIPKELLNQCRHGCPVRIELFCKTWKSLQSNTNIENELSIQNVRISSKGRRIVPPLSYWNGERFSTKQDVSVYTPGFEQDSSAKYTNNTPNKGEHMKETKKQQNNSNKENGSKESKSSNTYLTENKTNENMVKGTEKVEDVRSKVVNRKKKRLAPRLSNSSNSTDSKSSPAKKRQRFTKNLQESYSSDDEEESPKKLRKHSLETEETRRKARSNAKLSPVHVKKMSTNRYSSSTGDRCSTNYLFCRNKPRLREDDTLSEDQESYVQ